MYKLIFLNHLTRRKSLKPLTHKGLLRVRKYEKKEKNNRDICNVTAQTKHQVSYQGTAYTSQTLVALKYLWLVRYPRNINHKAKVQHKANFILVVTNTLLQTSEIAVRWRKWRTCAFMSASRQAVICFKLLTTLQQKTNFLCPVVFHLKKSFIQSPGSGFTQ